MLHWDIFCKVVDNFGDIGVAWRLARQLKVEYGQEVRLWLDDVAALAAIWPEVRADLTEQTLEGVLVVHWSHSLDWDAVRVADAVVEGFDCKLPAAYINAMMVQKAMAGDAPYWFNLEYLTAEPWANECHLMSSPQAGGLSRVFFFPGFNVHTGGLLRESASQNPMSWHDLTGFSPVAHALKINVFGYERMPLIDWLPCLVNGTQTVQLAVTHGQAAQAMKKAWQALGYANDGQQGQLSLRFMPMLAQNSFDDLLAGADLNFIRGEDSLVRAIWAGAPLIWHIYAQDDGVHMHKLEAFMAQYPSNEAWQAMMRVWNGVAGFNMAHVWADVLDNLPVMSKEAQAYQQQLRQYDDLAQQLTRCCGVYKQK